GAGARLGVLDERRQHGQGRQRHDEGLLCQHAKSSLRHRRKGDALRVGQGSGARHHGAGGGGTHAGPYRLRGGLGFGTHAGAVGRHQHPAILPAQSRLARGVRHRAREGGGDAAEVLRHGGGREGAHCRLPLPVPVGRLCGKGWHGLSAGVGRLGSPALIGPASGAGGGAAACGAGISTGAFMMMRIWLCAVALGAMICGAAAEPLVERGGYLVNAVMACDGCHTPRGAGGVFVMEKRFSGGSQTWDTPKYTVKGSNITPDGDTGIGGWTEADLKRALTDGVRPNGVPLAPQMPFAFYRILTAHDLDAIVAYV